MTNPQYRGSQTSRPSTLHLVLLNARSVFNKAQVIHDLILEEDADLACITEIWIDGEGGPPQHSSVHPVMLSNTRVDWRVGGNSHYL